MMRRRAVVAVLAGLVLPAAPAFAIAASERARIEQLIGFVAARKDVRFLRNGNAYSSAEAARFLRGKFEKMGEHVTTARDFIEQIAARSSTTGQPYLIRLPDGRIEPAAKFLGDELRRIDAGT